GVYKFWNNSCITMFDETVRTIEKRIADFTFLPVGVNRHFGMEVFTKGVEAQQVDGWLPRQADTFEKFHKECD
ncbi:hypothetical protein M8C21_026318, partial [Ambrosia artemisiifolia]